MKNFIAVVLVSIGLFEVLPCKSIAAPTIESLFHYASLIRELEEDEMYNGRLSIIYELYDEKLKPGENHGVQPGQREKVRKARKQNEQLRNKYGLRFNSIAAEFSHYKISQDERPPLSYLETNFLDVSKTYLLDQGTRLLRVLALETEKSTKKISANFKTFRNTIVLETPPQSREQGSNFAWSESTQRCFSDLVGSLKNFANKYGKAIDQLSVVFAAAYPQQVISIKTFERDNEWPAVTWRNGLVSSMFDYSIAGLFPDPESPSARRSNNTSAAPKSFFDFVALVSKQTSETKRIACSEGMKLVQSTPDSK